ncbi:MAG: hypothetical protein R3C24_09195 [Cyanobacteriota/Melainabacteria group bacterium]
MHQPLDVVLRIYVSYLDMGVTFGISAVIALSIRCCAFTIGKVLPMDEELNKGDI